MSSEIILRVENVGKQYRLGLVGTGTLSHDLNRWWSKIRGKEDPYLKIGETNKRSEKGETDYVWAIKDINFEVKRGEVLGIIGKNGAGKSTLLKILSRVTSPSTGEIKTKGRIASLLEVGTGFHPEMTGRENVYLNGAILGMTKKEINSKIEEIIEFSGCLRYIDTPVKRYSSGMKVRLAFAVAAFLEPDILVVDEVLAVGDAEFQKKAIGKMQDISNSDGRTVLFVSHNMEAVQKLCTRCIVLKDGNISFVGNVDQAVYMYLNLFSEDKLKKGDYPIVLNDIKIEKFTLLNENNFETENLISGNHYRFMLSVTNRNDFEMHLNIRIQIFDENEGLLSTLNTFHTNSTLRVGEDEVAEFNCIIDRLQLTEGQYFVGIQIIDLNSRNEIYHNDKILNISVVNGDYFGSGKLPNKKNLGKFLSNFKWENKINDIA
ncbi:ABC transporter ATP-binding protein [Winogradskyella sp. MH6]|uniref:ABC transporter ATP-binding protein n=1 Tax=Winogradskyella sp. MH6 TaxID=2929510 RepID=UPI001FB43978|nr:ABC transporter ATP-binding protein [Winogradskyella sp. MH6]